MTFRRALVVASMASLALFAGCKQDKPAQPAANAQAKAPIAAPAGAPAKVVLQKISIPETAPSIGPADAKVTIVEWSDFQCPFCSRAKGTVDQVREQYGNDVRVVFRHQPLPFHPQAQIAAEASMAAHEQGKFWEYHDKLFANAKALMRTDLERYAQELGLDMAKFKAALDTGKYKAVVQADAAEGARVGANGTPTFFINGRKLVGAQPVDAFKREIDAELAIANQLIEKGTKPSEIYAARMAAASAPSAPQEDSVFEVPAGDSPSTGKADAPVTIVAFSDFQCPFCSRVVPTLKSLEEKYGEKVRVVFKHQPLPFHQDARLAAAASMAAHEQGKFWEYHDKLFANAKALKRAGSGEVREGARARPGEVQGRARLEQVRERHRR